MKEQDENSISENKNISENSAENPPVFETLEGSALVEEHLKKDVETVVQSEEEVENSEPEFSEGPGISDENPDVENKDPLEEEVILSEKSSEKPAEVLVTDESEKEEEHEKNSIESTQSKNAEEAKDLSESTSDEVVSDEELEGEDDTEDVHSDEDEVQDEHEIEVVDYSEFSPEKLVTEAEKLIKNEPVEKLREPIESIRKNLLKQLNEERQEKLEEFKEGGGIEMDFEYVQPLRESFRKIFGAYRSQRKKHFDAKRKVLDDNLLVKQNLIEKIKELVNKDESIGQTFKEFNTVQQEWRETGPVPRTESGDLWRTYHHHVENFYEYIKINKELRDLDYRKNREAKEELIGKAEALGELKSIRESFQLLQQYHKEWKRIGPVEREYREPLWERFTLATKKVYEKRDAYFKDQREKAEELLEEKRKVVAEIEDFVAQDFQSHSQWQQAIKKMNDLRESFKKIGRIHHPENDKIWEQLREANRKFNKAKNNFYRDQKKEYEDNLAKKQELLDIAESLKDSEDWQETANTLKRIQADWKRIGYVPRSQADKIWKKFRAACNHFFDRLSEKNKVRDHQFEANLDTKKAALKELQDYEIKPDNQKDTVKELKKLIGKWKSIGPVPRGKNKIEDQFNKALDDKFNAIDLDRKEALRIRYENKMESLSQGGAGDLKRERQSLRRNLEDAQKELNQLETNLSFFSGNSKNPLLKEAEKNIQRQRDQIDSIGAKIKMLNIKIREMEKPKDEEAKSEE